MTHKVFVYGSLKKGYYNHRLLDSATLLGPAQTVRRWSMMLNGFPVVTNGVDGHVTGEVYEIDGATLARLDRLESNGRMYIRKLVNIVYTDDDPQYVPQVAKVWMYVGNKKFWQHRILPPIKPIGDLLIWDPRI